MRGSVLGWALNAVAMALLGVYLLAAIPRAADLSMFMLRLPARAAHESLAAARARLFGDEYVRAIEAIRRDLAVDRPYVLVAGDRHPSGAVYWVRYDLAPRRAVFIGQLAQLTDASRLRRELDADLSQVVVAYTGQPPRLYDRSGLAREIERRSAAARARAAPANAR